MTRAYRCAIARVRRARHALGRAGRTALAILLIGFVGLQGLPALALPVSGQALGLMASTSVVPQAPGSMVIDYPGGFTSATPGRLRRANIGIVVRYVGAARWKCLTRGEANALRAQGIDIATVYESSTKWMLGGRAAGIAAAKKARAASIACGGPSTPFVYFACDTNTNRYGTVNSCLRGAASVLGASHVGIYGSYSVCANALKSGYASKAWQTEAWSHGKVLPQAVLYQKAGRVNGSLGLDYDSDLLRADDIGQWGYSASGFAWTPQSTPATATLNSVAFTDPSNGWAVGDGGVVLHTIDGGATWTTQSTPATATLRSVAFADTNTGWAVGDGGTVLHTSNGGVMWTPQSTHATATLNSVAFTDPSNGWAVGDGGTVMHTSNGGATWITQSTPTTATLRSVRFTDANNGWAVGDGGTVLHTIDGGATWTVQSAPATATLRSVAFTDANNGWAVGDAGTVLHTTDGGTTWTPQSTPSAAILRSVRFTDASTGWAVGDAGTLIHTTDGGASWTAQPNPATATLNSVAFTDASTGWAVGDAGTVLHAAYVGGPEFFGHIAGVVIDAKSGARVSGASVQIGSRPTVATATDGTFVVARVTPGAYNVTVTSPLYITCTTSGVGVSLGGTATLKMRPTPRAATAVRGLAVGPAAPLRSVVTSLTATLTPASAASSTISTIYLSHYVQKTVTKKVKGKKKKVKVWYWRAPSRLTMAADASGHLLAQAAFAPGKWRAYVTCSGSGRYLPSTSATLSFSVQ